MGTLLKAQCSCGYQAEAVIGSDKFNHGKYYGFPYRCNQCQIVTTVDLLQEKRKCTQCAGSEINTYATPTTPCPMPILEKLNDWWLSLFGWHKQEDEYHSVDDQLQFLRYRSSLKWAHSSRSPSLRMPLLNCNVTLWIKQQIN